MAKLLADWTGKAAIITGGSSGIGKALAQRLVQQGASVAIVARNPEKLTQAQGAIAAHCRSANQQVCIYSADVSDRLQAERAIQEAMGTLGTPALLVTSAGIAHPGYFQDLPIEIFERTMAINYFGSLYCIRAAVPAMVAQGQGQIAMISSGAGLIGIYGYTPYSPSKFALRGLAESLRGELKPMGVGVSIVYPPDTDTPQLAEENKTKPPETKRITATADTWSADGVAREIITGLQKQALTIAPGLEMSVLAKLHSVIAPGLNWYFDRIVREVRGG